MVTTVHPSAIEVESLSKVYRQSGKTTVRAVDDLSLSVSAGQVFGFLGANGAGKTTTIKMICGVVIPTSGHVRVNGYDVSRDRSKAMRQIGAVLEGTRNVYWRLTAWENLMYFGRLKGCRGKQLKAHAEHLLRELDLWDRRNDALRVYSRGMQQKVAIACALVSDPPIILLDEPTLGLDFQAARTVKEWISRLTHEQGKTVILTTHQLDLAQELCDHVGVIRKGRLLTNQPLTDLLHLFRQEHYQIRIKGDFNGHDTSQFDELSIEKENGETILTGAIADQAILHQYLSRVYDLHLPLLSVTRIEPNLEEVFVQLLNEGEKGEQQHEDRVVSYIQ